MMRIVNYDKDVCALTDTGLVRPKNEDSNRVESTTNGELFVVCDGMGGHVGGATASRIGVDSICQYVTEHECVIPQQFLVKALEFANEKIYAESRSNPDLRGMGTTACVALVREGKVWYAHVGDSRIYYFNVKTNSLYRLTKDHSVVQALVDQGLITEAEAEHHPDKNKIRKSLGIKAEVEAEPCQMPLVPADGDILIICTDGLSGMMSEEDMSEILTTTNDVNEAGKTLMELAKASGGTDNITVQLVRFSNTGNHEAIFDAKNKGVSNGEAPAIEKSQKRIWPWIAILASTLIIVLAAIALLTNKNGKPSTELPIEEIYENTNANVSQKVEAYKKDIPPGALPIDFYDKDKGTNFQYYKNPEDPTRELLVNVDNGSYWIGVIEYIPQNGIYQVVRGKAKYYNADGSLQN